MRGREFALVCAVFSMVGVVAITPQAQTFTNLQSFDGANGATPDPKPIVQGADGKLYGTAPNGGAYGGGTAFKLTPNGNLTVLYNFCSLPNCADGSNPVAGLVLGSDQFFYGITGGGGVNNYGEVFRMSSKGKLTILHSFDTTDGAYPNSALVQGVDGGFYGTTQAGGNLAACSGFGCGTVFKVTAEGKFISLHNFCEQLNCTDGEISYDGLAVGPDGNFYGGTWQGGANNLGTIYRVSSEGRFATLYSFCQNGVCAGGDNPLWLTLGNDGNFYGTTFSGGPHAAGEVFKITPGGRLTALYGFCSKHGCPDGSSPRAGLWLGSDGDLYGTTFYGGSNDGTVFKITPAGLLTTLHSFDGSDGANPIGGVGQSTNGIFYGTTQQGGANGDGTIFSVAEGLAASLQTAPVVGKVGQRILILGTGLTGASSVSFNGDQARFTVNSDTLITAIIPTGATTGPLNVVVADGTFTSGRNFLIVP